LRKNPEDFEDQMNRRVTEAEVLREKVATNLLRGQFLKELRDYAEDILGAARQKSAAGRPSAQVGEFVLIRSAGEN
jgi:hypothetical protein